MISRWVACCPCILAIVPPVCDQEEESCMFTFMNRKKVQSQLTIEGALTDCADFIWTSKGIVSLSKVFAVDGSTASEGSSVSEPRWLDAMPALVENGFAQCVEAQEQRERVCERERNDKERCQSLGCCVFDAGACWAGEGSCAQSGQSVLTELEAQHPFPCSTDAWCSEVPVSTLASKWEEVRELWKMIKGKTDSAKMSDDDKAVYRVSVERNVKAALEAMCNNTIFGECCECGDILSTDTTPFPVLVIPSSLSTTASPDTTTASPDTTTASPDTTTASPETTTASDTTPSPSIYYNTASPRRRRSACTDPYEQHIIGACGDKLHWFSSGETCSGVDTVASCYEATLLKPECNKDFFTFNERGNKNCACKLSNETSVKVHTEETQDCYRIKAPYMLVGHGIAGALHHVKWLSPAAGAVPPHFAGVQECYDKVKETDECEQDYFTFNWHSEMGCGCKTSAEDPLVVTASDLSLYFKMQDACQ